MTATTTEAEELKGQLETIQKELEETKTRLNETERERDRTKSELHDVREELERSQSQFDEVLGELEQTHFELHQLKEKKEEAPSKIAPEVTPELEATKSQLQSLQAELTKIKSELQDKREELERTYSQLDQIMGELEESNFELHQLKEKGESESPGALKKELEKSQAEFQRFQTKLQTARNQLQQTLTQLQQTQQELQTTKAAYAAHVTKTLVNILLPTVQEENIDGPIHSQGAIRQLERIVGIAEYCIRGWGGDLIEIGCGQGETTKLLAAVARKYNRQVISVLIEETGNENSQEGDYEAFLKNIEVYQDSVHVIRVSSLDEKAIEQIKNRELCFAFVDGLHTYDGCLKEIETVAHCQGIIGVDDLLWCSDVERAFQKGAEVIHRSKLHFPICREGYLLPSG